MASLTCYQKHCWFVYSNSAKTDWLLYYKRCGRVIIKAKCDWKAMSHKHIATEMCAVYWLIFSCHMYVEFTWLILAHCSFGVWRHDKQIFFTSNVFFWGYLWMISKKKINLSVWQLTYLVIHFIFIYDVSLNWLHVVH